MIITLFGHSIRVAGVLSGLALLAALLVLTPLIFQWIFNSVIVEHFGLLKALSFWQSVGLLLLFQMIFGSVRTRERMRE